MTTQTADSTEVLPNSLMRVGDQGGQTRGAAGSRRLEAPQTRKVSGAV
jgi:hypothetical protein